MEFGLLLTNANVIMGLGTLSSAREMELERNDSPADYATSLNDVVANEIDLIEKATR